jgi:hypothetical protein
LDRVAASVGLLCEAEIIFQPVQDVSNAGVLLALPSLLEMGLVSAATKHFQLPKGFYGLQSIFLMMAFFALARIKCMEDLRYVPPGEWGKILGLDRIPEVRTMREKFEYLSSQEVLPWMLELSEQWINKEPETAGIFFVDGHTRPYHGSQTELPKHYVARERLCLRATTDYWVNGLEGQPFFYVSKIVDPGMVQMLENEIVPQCEKLLHVPDLLAPQTPRMTIIFDRAGYSPDLFARLINKGIACVTYRKNVNDDWDENEFQSTVVKLTNGDTTEMKLAERGIYLGEAIWAREIRKLCDSGHQTPVVTTHKQIKNDRVAALMFGRWGQENFFKYMMQHYGIDKLVTYMLDDVPDTTILVNPAHRDIDSQVRKQAALIQKKEAQYGMLSIPGEITPKNVEQFEQKKAALIDEITALKTVVNDLKQKRKATPRHIEFKQLPNEQKFKRLHQKSKYLIDTIKMVAYRAETSMVSVLREKMSHRDESRRLAQTIYSQSGDLLPDYIKKTLTVRLHHFANHAEDKAILHLCEELNATNTCFPGTNLILHYKLGASSFS